MAAQLAASQEGLTSVNACTLSDLLDFLKSQYFTLQTLIRKEAERFLGVISRNVT
jgi:hypothetical protein